MASQCLLQCPYDHILLTCSLGNESDDLCDDTNGSFGIRSRLLFEKTIWVSWMPWLVVFAIICAAFLALSQREIKRMLAYLIVAEVGYMVGGVWIYNYYGLIGSIFHIISDACMTLCLFLGAGIVLHKCKTTHFDGLRDYFLECPSP